MSDQPKRPRAPAGLGAAGRALWRDLVGTYEFDPGELVVLRAAAGQADLVADLERSLAADGLVVPGSTGQPRLSAVVAELRQGRLALARLVSELSLPADGEALSPSARRAQRAAMVRWRKKQEGVARGATSAS